MDEIDDFTDRASDSADAIGEVFEQAGGRIAEALDRAARSGELSFNRLAESILQDLAGTAIQELIAGPLSQAIGGLAGGGSGGGGGNPLNIVMNLTGVSDSKGFERSKGQIAAGLARAVGSGQRYGG